MLDSEAPDGFSVGRPQPRPAAERAPSAMARLERMGERPAPEAGPVFRRVRASARRRPRGDESEASSSASSWASASGSTSGSASAGPRRAPWSWRRRIVVAVAVVLVCLVAFYLANLWHVWRVGQADERRPVDVIVVMGAAQYDGRPSPQLAARLDHALELYRQGLAPQVFVTGGKQPADRFTEAQSSARYLQDRGVPESAILREDQGRNSWQSLSAVAAQVKANGKHSVLLVSDPYHSARIKGIAEELGLAAYVSPTRTSPVTGWVAVRRELQEAAGVSVAEVFGYQRLSDWTD